MQEVTREQELPATSDTQSLYAQIRSELHTIACGTQQVQCKSKIVQNFLRQTKAYNWAVYEWIYAYIDEPLLLQDNEFQRMLSTNFKGRLRGDLITSTEWQLIRNQLQPKPRRFSAHFIAQERAHLQQQRQMLRMLQVARKTWLQKTQLEMLPKRIPYILRNKSIVNCELFYKNELVGGGATKLGIFRCIIISIRCNLNTSTRYIIQLLDDLKLTLSVQDIYIIAPKRQKWLRLQKCHANQEDQSPPASSPLFIRMAAALPVLATPNQKYEQHLYDKYIENLLHLQQIIQWKRRYLCLLNEQNDNIEKMRNQMSEHLRKQYAIHILALETINRQLALRLQEIVKLQNHLELQASFDPPIAPTCYTECNRMAVQAVTSCCERLNKQLIGPSAASYIMLITELATAIFILAHIENDIDGCALRYCLQKLRTSLISGHNLEQFDDLLVKFKKLQEYNIECAQSNK